MYRSLLAAAAAVLLLAPVSASAQDDDIAAQVEAICCGAECCLIAGVCLGRGDMNPSDSCEVCDPSTSQSSFSAVASCGATDAGTPATDSGTPAVDAGTTTPPDDGGCAVSPGSSSNAGMALGLLALGALFVRRRRS